MVNFLCQKRLDFLDAIRLLRTMMYHCMTIRTNWTKVGDRINLVIFSNSGKLK